MLSTLVTNTITDATETAYATCHHVKTRTGGAESAETAVVVVDDECSFVAGETDIGSSDRRAKASDRADLLCGDLYSPKRL